MKLIAENQHVHFFCILDVVKSWKAEKQWNLSSPLRFESAPPTFQVSATVCPLCHNNHYCKGSVNFSTDLFSNVIVKSEMVAVYQMRLNWDKYGCFPQKMYSDRRKNYGCGREKPEGTTCSSAMFGIGTAAKCCELERYKLRHWSCSMKLISSRFRL